jgi:hypothetical protein
MACGSPAMMNARQTDCFTNKSFTYKRTEVTVVSLKTEISILFSFYLPMIYVSKFFQIFDSKGDHFCVILIPLSTNRLRIVSPRISGDRTIVTPV